LAQANSQNRGLNVQARQNQMDHVCQLQDTSRTAAARANHVAEYALVVTLVSAAGLLFWSTLGSNISRLISSIAGCI
jgi:hypothetical protein